METFTNLPANRQGSALVLSLEDEALDAVLEIDDKDIAKENGVDAIIERLNRLFKKDYTITKYQRLYKMKSYGTVQSDNILAYCLLKPANLSEKHEEMTTATIPELNYDMMKD